MEPIIVAATRVDQTRHAATLGQAQIRALVVEAVAKAAGVPLSASNVMVDQVLFVFNDTNPGREVSVQCTLVVDHTRLMGAERAAAAGHSLD
jgi:hypothetical protein